MSIASAMLIKSLLASTFSVVVTGIVVAPTVFADFLIVPQLVNVNAIVMMATVIHCLCFILFLFPNGLYIIKVQRYNNILYL